MLFTSPFKFFIDPVLRAPTIGCMLMCLAAALVGVIVFLRKQSLLGESLSHAAYPGVIGGVTLAGILGIDEQSDSILAFLIACGGILSAVLGLKLINFLIRKIKVPADAALCFVLSCFFGIGLTLASQIQFTYTSLYRQVQVYFYGQAATMTDVHIVIYGCLSFSVILLIVFSYKELQAITFDKEYAQSLGLKTGLIDSLLFFLIILAVVIGIRSVGVVLMSAMLIAPAAAARQFTNHLSILFILSAFFGVFSGFIGNYLSVEGTYFLFRTYPGMRLALPTGPMIVLVASTLCLLSLFWAPKRGLLWRLCRMASFRQSCLQENLLKYLWRKGNDQVVSFKELRMDQQTNALMLFFNLCLLRLKGWIYKNPDKLYGLTPQGVVWGARIVRLHRLWEVYLADYLGIGIEKIHRSAEEMEHILTPQLESELTLLLKDPLLDPHQQPIPAKEGRPSHE